MLNVHLDECFFCFVLNVCSCIKYNKDSASTVHTAQSMVLFTDMT